MSARPSTRSTTQPLWKLWCYVPDSHSDVFEVDISPTQTVSKLRKAIHEEIQPGVAVIALALWKVSLSDLVVTRLQFNLGLL
jgi:hypothetical protein